MTFRQQSSPYAHWEFVHPTSGDRLRVVPERGGLVTGWCCEGRDDADAPEVFLLLFLVDMAIRRWENVLGVYDYTFGLLTKRA